MLAIYNGSMAFALGGGLVAWLRCLASRHCLASSNGQTLALLASYSLCGLDVRAVVTRRLALPSKIPA